jgi:hypothetical protein
MLTVLVRRQGFPFIRYAFTISPLTTDMGYDIRVGIMIMVGLGHINYPDPVDGGFALLGRKSYGGVVPGMPIPFPNAQ